MNRHHLFILFSAIAAFGFVDLASRIALHMDPGIISSVVLYLFSFVFGNQIAATAAVLVNLISNCWIIFALIAYANRDKKDTKKK